MQTNSKPNTKSLSDLILERAELKAAVEARGREFRARKDAGGVVPEEEVMEFIELMGKELDAKLCLERCLKHAIALDDVDPSVRAEILDLVRKNKEQASELLEDEEFEIGHDKEFDGDAWNFVYDLGGPKDILLRYRQTSVMVTAATVPGRIVQLLEEARTAYAVGQSHAVFALGRMIIEAAITDIGVRIGRFPEPASLEDFYSAYPPGNRANKLLGTKGKRREEFRELYDAGSKAIHPSNQSTGIEPLEYLDRVVGFVNNEYAIQVRK